MSWWTKRIRIGMVRNSDLPDYLKCGMTTIDLGVVREWRQCSCKRMFCVGDGNKTSSLCDICDSRR